MKRFLKPAAVLTALCLLLSACQSQPAEPEAPAVPEPPAQTEDKPAVPADGEWVNPKLNDYTLTKLRLIGRGEASEDYKIAFFEPKTLDGAKAFLIGYSVEPFAVVWDTLSALSYDELCALDKPVNRAYVMTDLSYCDGVGNTFNTAQKDLVNGEDFTEPGTHYFYVAVLGENGLLSLERTDKTMSVSPIAGELAFTQEAGTVNGSFVSHLDSDIQKNFVFLSADGYDRVREQLKTKNRAALDALAADGCALAFENAEQNEFSLVLADGKDLSGSALDPQGCYYVYVASASEQKPLGLSYCADQLVTPEDFSVSDAVIGDGKGVIFPNGGAAQIGGGRGSIISTAQAAFKDLPDQPRIAVIGAASGSERDFWTHFYVDGSSSKSFQSRFKEAGFEAVYIPLTAENRDTIGSSDYYAALISNCHGVYFTGGDQSLGMYALTLPDGGLNPLGQAICDLYARGGFLAGTSAGAHMLGNICFQDSSSVDSLSHPVPLRTSLSSEGVTCGPEGVVYDGIPCVTGAAGQTVVFDSHFGARGRLARLSVMQGAAKAPFAVGLDEATGLAISDGIGVVYGVGTVTVLDARSAEYGSTEERFAVSGLRVFVLSAGDKFDFANGVLLPADSKAAAGDYTAEPVQDLLGPSCAQARALLSFALSSDAEADYTVEADNGSFAFTLTKADDFSAFVGDKPFEVSALADLNRSAVGAILLDIR